MAEKTKRKRPKKPKVVQGYLPDMEPPSIKEINDAAEEYVDSKNEAAGSAEEAKISHDNLLALMRKHNLESYTYDGKLVKLVPGEPKVKVKKIAAPESNGEAEGGEDS